MTPAILCAIAEPPPTVRTLLEVYYRFMGYTIIYLSAFPDSDRPYMETWLRDHHCPPGPVFMDGVWDASAYDVRFLISDKGFPSIPGLPWFFYAED